MLWFLVTFLTHRKVMALKMCLSKNFHKLFFTALKAILPFFCLKIIILFLLKSTHLSSFRIPSWSILCPDGFSISEFCPKPSFWFLMPNSFEKWIWISTLTELKILYTIIRDFIYCISHAILPPLILVNWWAVPKIVVPCFFSVKYSVDICITTIYY